MVGYYKSESGCEAADSDVRFLYRGKPGCVISPSPDDRFNTFRARGPKRTRQKPPGVFRIVCTGGSNVFGQDVPARSAWPAQLEAKLNEAAPGRYEVWNMGLNAYVGEQMAAVAEEALENDQPDLILFGLSNTGARCFFAGASLRPIFDGRPEFYELFFEPDYVFAPFGISYESNIRLIRNSRLYRFFQAALLIRKNYNWRESLQHERRNIECVRAFIEKSVGRVRTGFVLYPGIGGGDLKDYEPYYKDSGVPVLQMHEDGLPPEYDNIHPPASVTPWYAEKIARWLRETRLVQ